MSNLKHWKEKIKQKRKNTDFRDFLMEIASFFPVVFYKNNSLISRYPKTPRIKGVISSDEFESNRENLPYINYSFNKGFFENFSDLILKIDLPNISTYGGCENSDYADTTYNIKNTYLTFNCIYDNENIFYSCFIKDKCSDIYNSIMVWDGSSNVYFGFGIINSYKVFYSKFINNSNNIWFSSNLVGCSECILCDGLDNQKYCINNEKLDKSEYLKRKEEILNEKHDYIELYKSITSSGKNFSSTNSKGSFIVESQDIENGNLVYQVNKGRNLFVVGSKNGNENMYDIFIGGSNVSKDLYGCCNTGTAENIYMVDSVGMSSNIFYSHYLQDCSFCFMMYMT